MTKKRELCVDVPDDVTSKTELITSISEQLKLPFKCGMNWDALDDILTDFSWLEEEIIIINHQNVPKLPKDQRDIYIEILIDAVDDWQSEGGKRLVVSFG